MNTVKRNVVFIATYSVAVAAYLWFDPIASENISDLAGVLIPAAGGLGLLWANARSFASIQNRWYRLTARAALIGVVFAALCLAVYAYSWHVRPMLGLQCKANTVANQLNGRVRPNSK